MPCTLVKPVSPTNRILVMSKGTADGADVVEVWRRAKFSDGYTAVVNPEALDLLAKQVHPCCVALDRPSTSTVQDSLCKSLCSLEGFCHSAELSAELAPHLVSYSCSDSIRTCSFSKRLNWLLSAWRLAAFVEFFRACISAKSFSSSSV